MLTNRFERSEVFEEKFVSIVDALESIPEIPELLSQKEIAFERICDSVDAALDIVAMILEDVGECISDDIINVLKLGALGLLDADLVSGLLKCTSVNILLTQKLDCFDDRAVLNSIDEIRKILYSFIDHVELLTCSDEAYMD